MFLKGMKELKNFMTFFYPLAKRMSFNKKHVASFESSASFLMRFFKSDIFVGNLATFELINLCHLKGKTVILDILTPDLEEKLKKVLTAAGVAVDDARVKATVAALEGVNIDEAISKAAVAAPVAAAPSAAPAGEAKEEKKEKPKDEGKSETEAAAGLGSLFG